MQSAGYESNAKKSLNPILADITETQTDGVCYFVSNRYCLCETLFQFENVGLALTGSVVLVIRS